MVVSSGADIQNVNMLFEGKDYFTFIIHSLQIRCYFAMNLILSMIHMPFNYSTNS